MSERWWGKLKVEDRIREDVTVTAQDFTEALMNICEHFDLTKPMVVDKHISEVARFFRTVFYPDDFIENVPFDTLDIEKINIKKKK